MTDCEIIKQLKKILCVTKCSCGCPVFPDGKLTNYWNPFESHDDVQVVIKWIAKRSKKVEGNYPFDILVNQLILSAEANYPEIITKTTYHVAATYLLTPRQKCEACIEVFKAMEKWEDKSYE